MDLTISLLTIFGTVPSVSGVVLFVFNGTKKIIRETNELIQEIHGTIDKQTETLNKQTNKQRH